MSTGYARSVEEARLLAHAILNLGQLHMEQGKLDDADDGGHKALCPPSR